MWWIYLELFFPKEQYFDWTISHKQNVGPQLVPKDIKHTYIHTICAEKEERYKVTYTL